MTRHARSPLPALAVLLLSSCGGGSSAPSATPVPPASQGATRLATATFSGSPRLTRGTAQTPQRDVPGTFTFIASWTPGPPEGQVFLLVVRNGRLVDPGDDTELCGSDFNCALILAKDISSASPKQVSIHLGAGERVWFWVEVQSGNVTVTVETWFKQD